MSEWFGEDHGSQIWMCCTSRCPQERFLEEVMVGDAGWGVKSEKRWEWGNSILYRDDRSLLDETRTAKHFKKT